MRESLAIAAIMASATSIFLLQEFVSTFYPCPIDVFLNFYLSTWSSSGDPPLDLLPGRQEDWKCATFQTNFVKIG